MFEGLVHRVLVGYLGRYVKNFQKDQLKLSLWNEEVLLENVELIPEAFDYLQFPFAIKQGRVGRLSIKISWKKLGWDYPIIVVLEDVFICASQRDDYEWTMEAIETREYAGKKAQLAAAELAKLSRRVCDNQAGKSFISYITAKVLDSIQMSIKHFHVQYCGMQPDSVFFGLKFSSLTIKQSLVGSSGVKMAGGQVYKTADIKGLEFYSATFKGVAKSTSWNDAACSTIWSSERPEGITLDHLLHPFDVTASLVVNRAGKPDNDMAQYSIRAEITGLGISLDEVQLQQIMVLADYISISRLREKYGRYRPWGHFLSRKQNGWQILWWHYAQESILSDVRRKLKKTSWRYLGQRLNSRRKYINLYKIKLQFLQQEQLIDEFILWELEQMEKEFEIDDILNYRSAAECELQEALPNSPSSITGVNGVSISMEKSRNDEHLSGRSRGWLNWLSRGMLGAGGTDDSAQFSGVVSDEVVKDIYEATKFHPSALTNGDADATDKVFTFAIKLSIGQIVAALQSKYASQKIADLEFKDIVIECKLWEQLASVTCFFKSGTMVYPCNESVILQIGRPLTEKTLQEDELVPCSVQVDVSPKQVELSVKVMLQPLEVNFDVEFFIIFMAFFTVLKSVEFQEKRVLWSLNGFEDVKTRLLSKAEYTLSSQTKLSWDVSILNVIIYVPGRDDISGKYNLVLELGSLLCMSKYEMESTVAKIQEESYILQLSSSSTFATDFLTDLKIQDLYSYFAVKLENLELKLEIPQHTQTLTILEKFCASITFASCIISDESILKQFEVYVMLPSIAVNFSLPIYKSILALLVYLDNLHATTKTPYSHNVMSNQPWATAVCFSITAKLKSVSFHVDFAKDGEGFSEVLLSLQESEICYCHTEFEECFVFAKALKVSALSARDENDGCILLSSGDQFASGIAHYQDLEFGNSNQDVNCSDRALFTDGSFQLHYKGHRSVDFVFHEYTIELKDVDLHCYPLIFGRLIAFYERLSSCGQYSMLDKSFSHVIDGKNPEKRPDFHFQRFGYSNFLETGFSECASFSLDCYPFITISNSGSLGSLEHSLRHSIPDWRKSFKLRDSKITGPRFSLMKESKPAHASLMMHTSRTDSFPAPGILCNTDVLNVDINLSGVRIHFHDSSCIVGTVTIPTARSALLIYEDHLDLLCSTEGLGLASPWWTNNFKEFLWGPSLSNPSSILNLRVRTGSVTSQLEVSIGIQHVYCFLPPEYLAIIIGYFSSSDWGSNFGVQPVTDNSDCVIAEKENSVVYKFEILDSILILPVKQDEHQFLKIELKQLYCSFILNCSPDDVLKDIPYECIVPIHKVAKANHCLNIYGRDLFLSILLCKDDEHGCLMLSEDTGCGSITLIAPLSADVWVRLPCEREPCLNNTSASTCVMLRIANCQLVSDDCYTLHGFQALMDIINQFSCVSDESRCFTSDVLQFFQLKRSLKESGGVPPVVSATVFTEAQCCVNSLSIIFYQSRKDSIMSKPIAKADVQLICSVSLINDTPIDVDLSFSCFALHSLLNSVMIAQCANVHSASSALHICSSKSIEGEYEFHVSVPSLNIWLHVVEWSAVIDFYNSCSKIMAETVLMESSKSLSKDMSDHAENTAITVSHGSLLKTNPPIDHAKEPTDQDSFAFTVRSENIGLTVQFPIWDTQKACDETGSAEVQEQGPQLASSHTTEEKFKFVAATMHSKSTELSIVGRNVKLKSIFEKTSGTVGMCEDMSTTTWPFFEISQITVMTEIYNNHIDNIDIKLEVQVDCLDVLLSHQVFCFWYGVRFDIPESGNSQSSFGSMELKIQSRKVSLLLSDERWSCGGPLLEILMRNSPLHFIITENSFEGSVSSELEVNYNNIHKVLWEPFVEPWKFQINMIRRQKKSALLNQSIITDIHLSSTAPLNVNCTESFFECVFRTVEMVNDAWHLTITDPSEIQSFSSHHSADAISGGRYAPYVLQNLTSLPLVYHVFQGLVNKEEFDASEMEEGKAVEPGASVPIYLIETPEEQLIRFRSAQSSDRLSEKQSMVVHHFMCIQLEGMSLPSTPISMDLVGVTCFEVGFSKASNKIEVEKKRDISKYNLTTEESVSSDFNTGFTVPVIFDVSVKRYSKLLRLYSTVILSNATSLPLELRFDIPFGLSPKILDPIYPGQESPLPLHLAEAGRLRWRPLGNSYLWSEVHDLSNILSQEMKIGFLRSFVCYPTNPTSDPFRCCISVRNFSVPSSGKSKKSLSLRANITQNQSVEISTNDWKQSKKSFIHQVTLSTPLVLNNYLPEAISLTIESGGVTRTALISEAENSFYHVDPSHDLGLEFYVQGYKPSPLKFPRTETFSKMAKFNGTKFSLIETMTFDPELSTGPLYVTVEKMMDALSGAREIFIYVPFLVYNCTGLPLNILDSAVGINRNYYIVPSCYLIEHELLQEKKDGIHLLFSDQYTCAIAPQFDDLGSSSVENRIIFSGKNANPHLVRSLQKHVALSGSSQSFFRQSEKHDSVDKKDSSYMQSTSESTLTDYDFVDTELRKAKACMYSPCAISSEDEFMVRLRRCLPEHVAEKEQNSSWSEPFLLVPPSGSSTVHVPQSSPNAVFIISVTASALGGPIAGRTQAITFQPRYVISNACSRDLWYRQKGTEPSVHLRIGQHSHLHWTDKMRDLLVSVRFNEPGWQWSGSFLPDHLGDTQVKMRNYMSGSLHMIRVEVQNADVSIKDEKIVGSLHGNLGTNLILLSDDDTGFMPYRIDNFSKERLRIYQQRCETFDTIIHPYTSCPYSWDEPCYPHRLTVEVVGERVVGLYALDDLKEYIPVHLKSTSEKPERTLLLSTHAEGSTKVLSIVDSGYHILKDSRDDPIPSWFQEKNKYDKKRDNFVDYNEKFSFAISCIGISLISAYPQELLFACAKDITVTLLQSLDQQKLSFQISSLQIDNQLRTTPYPVFLSFNPQYKSNTGSHRAKNDIANLKSERMLEVSSESCCEPVVELAVARWRKKDISLVSFEYISLRMANFCLELEQEHVLSLLDFLRSVSSRFQSSVLPNSDPSCCPLTYDVGFTHSWTYECTKTKQIQLHEINILTFNKSQIKNSSLPSVVPIGAPWQKIYCLARRQKKIYVELFDLAPIKFTLSFSSAPWMARNGFLTSRESIIHRGIMALADVEGAQIHLKQLKIAHQMSSWESIQDILTRHFTRQLLHEMYKIFGSAGVIGNPMGFARSLGLGIRDFLSVPARSILQSPTGIITGMAQGTTSLLSNTVYALSDAATQFSKSARKGIVAFTFDDQSRMEKQQKGVASTGVINEVLEGLTGLLQSPIKEAEKHGFPGVLSGIALGVTGLVARPAASILEVTGKTAQSIRNRSQLYQIRSQRCRVRLPRPLSRELPLRPYSLEDAVGTSVLMEVDDGQRLKDEVFVMCKSLKQAGKFIVVTERLVMIVSCRSLVDAGKPEYRGVPVDPEWLVESEIGLNSVIHADSLEDVVHIVGSSSDAMRQNQHQSKKGGGPRTKHWSSPSTRLPLFQTNLELASNKDAEELLQMLLSIIEQGKERGWGSAHLLHRSNIMLKEDNPYFLLGGNQL